jgi:DNA-directed RNA polymerase subunit E'/Rpb7
VNKEPDGSNEIFQFLEKERVLRTNRKTRWRIIQLKRQPKLKRSLSFANPNA